MLYAKKEADRIFIEKQHLKALKMKEDGRTLQDVYIHQMVSLDLICTLPFRDYNS